MTDNRLLAAWLRPLVGLIALAGVLALSACGGGSGAPNNPYAPGPTVPGPLVVLPPSATVFAGVPTTLTVTGGLPPYIAYSSNAAILPVAQAVAGSTVLILPLQSGPGHRGHDHRSGQRGDHRHRRAHGDAPRRCCPT